MVDTTLKFF